MFLYLDENKVKVKDDGWQIKILKEIHDSDRTTTKWKFEDIITALYHLYRPESIFDNISTDMREREVSENILKGDWDDYKNDKKVKQLVSLYKDMVTTPSIKNLERIKDDIDKLHEHLSSIPMEKVEWIDRDVEVKTKSGETERVRVQKKITISNIEEKEKVYQTFLKMHQTYEKLKAIVEKELASKKVNKSAQRMFDKPIKTPHNV